MDHAARSLEAHLAEAAGTDADLHHELRAAFIDSARGFVDLLGRSRCDANWHVAALRLRGLAASFHAHPLLDLAGEALDSAPGDPAILRRLRTHLDELCRMSPA